VVTICTTSLKLNNSTFCPHSAFMCFVWVWEQTAIISLYSINWLVFINETESVYCAVRTGSVRITWMNLAFQECPALIALLAGCLVRVSSGTNTLLRLSFIPHTWQHSSQDTSCFHPAYPSQCLETIPSTPQCIFRGIWKFSPYRAVNTLRLHYKNQSVNAV
jgi:hypothetical protein